MRLSPTLTASIVATLLASACTDAEPEARDERATSFEAFRDQSQRIVDGMPIYAVEGDVALTLDDLRAYYDTTIAPPEAGARSTVARIGNQDSVWRNGEQMNLTYCVSDAFDTPDWPDHARVVTAMDQAAKDWKAATGGSVKFVYRPSDDASCTETNPNVIIAVRPWENLGANAMSFMPNEHKGNLWVDLVAVDNSSLVTNKRLDGILRHELGHILGLKHEHVRAPNGGGCPAEGGDYAALTPYDRDSVMHYIQCGGNMSSSYIITARDAEGVRELYGPTPARPLAVVTPTGCVQGTPRFTLTWFSIRGVGASTFQAEIWRGSQWEMLSDGPAVSTTYAGVSGRIDYLSVRACNFFGCGSFSDAVPLVRTCP